LAKPFPIKQALEAYLLKELESFELKKDSEIAEFFKVKTRYVQHVRHQLRQRQTKLPKKYITRSGLNQHLTKSKTKKMLEDGKTYHDIAKLLCVSYQVAVVICRKQGLIMNPELKHQCKRNSKEILQEVHLLHQIGWDDKSIGIEIGKSTAAVNQIRYRMRKGQNKL